MKKTIALTAVLGLTTLGCGTNNDAPDLAGSGPAPAELRVAHLSPDAPPVDVWLDGAVVLSGVPFQAVSGHLPVGAGEHRVQVTPAGATEPVVIDATVDLASGVSYTVAATGLLGSGDLQPLVLVDERSSGPGSRVRFVHASPDAPGVDVALTGGAVLFPNVSFRESDGYLSVDPGVYDLEVRLAGTSTVALPLPGTTLPAGSVTVFAIGLVGDGSLAALPVLDS
jgi:hypothetical protein